MDATNQPPLLSVRGVAKDYRIWASPSAPLRQAAWRTAAACLPGGLRRAAQARAGACGRDFTALREISFDLPPGRSLGIIGRNGSGKSTLLQIVAGTLQPTRGRVERRGRVSALLELGSGFNPDFTGRENVFLNGVIQGFSRAEVEARFGEIAAFADIGDFMEQPLRMYSSGMAIRLAFAVAACHAPDLLIVDEALSVGDVFFQQKCFRRIREMLAGGTSLLFVSHDTAAVQNLCDEGILLHAGEVLHRGRPEECTSRYFSVETGKAPAGLYADGTRPAEAGPSVQAHGEIRAASLLAGAKARHGSRGLEFEAVAFFNEHGLPVPQVRLGGTGRICILLRAHADVAEPSVGLRLHDRLANLVFAAGNRQLRQTLPPLRKGDGLLVRFDLGFTVGPGPYTLTVDCGEPGTEGPNRGVFHDVAEGLGPITVQFGENDLWPFYGIAQLPLAMGCEPVPAP